MKSFQCINKIYTLRDRQCFTGVLDVQHGNERWSERGSSRVDVGASYTVGEEQVLAAFFGGRICASSLFRLKSADN